MDRPDDDNDDAPEGAGDVHDDAQNDPPPHDTRKEACRRGVGRFACVPKRRGMGDLMGKRHVFEDQRREDGSRLYSAAYLNEDGCLVIETHDMGPVVENTFGFSEYEAVETFDSEQTARLREHLGKNLIAAISERFPTSSRELTKQAESIGVGRGKVWNRIGD